MIYWNPEIFSNPDNGAFPYYWDYEGDNRTGLDYSIRDADGNILCLVPNVGIAEFLIEKVNREYEMNQARLARLNQRRNTGFRSDFDSSFEQGLPQSELIRPLKRSTTDEVDYF